MLAFFSALLQVNEDLKTIGALAGLLAVPGLAVLALLYFGQAREVRRLREWAGRAPERAAELEQRVTAEAQQRAQASVTAPSTPAAQAATGTQAKPAAAPAGNGVAKSPPGAPATVAAQAATAGAGVEKKDGDEADEKEGEEKKPEEAAAEKKDASDEEKKAEGEEPKPDEAAAEKKKKKEEDNEKEPVAAAAGPPTAASPAATPAGAAAAASAAARARAAAPPIPPRPAQPARASAPSATIPPRTGVRRPGGGGFTEPPPSSRVSRNGLIGIGAAVLVLAITVAIVLKVTSGGNDTPTPAPNTVAGSPAEQQDASGNPQAPAVSKAQRAQTNVAVLNGTTVTGLARSVANRLQDAGYTVGNVTDAPNQAQPATKVEYGSAHRDEAQALATAIKVPPSRVVALSPVDSTTAGPNAEVVVVVGQDSAR